MRNQARWLAAGLLTLTMTAPAQSAKPGSKQKPEHRTVTDVLNHAVSNLERDLIPAAEAMPADKFDFAPSNGEFKGVRNFGQQIKHIAAVNYEFAAAILQTKSPVDINNEEGPPSITAKTDVLKYLKDSFAYVHTAIDTINEKNLVDAVRSPFGEGTVTRLGLAQTIAPHGYDHYGQMVEYLRMNGIIPPASR
jgi:uncharacterized damage-inducible protein DinB